MVVLGYRAQFEQAAIVRSGRVLCSFIDRNDLGRVWGDCMLGETIPLGDYRVIYIDDYLSLRVDLSSNRYGYWINEWLGDLLISPNLELRTGVNVQNHVHRGYGYFSNRVYYHPEIELLFAVLSHLCWYGVI